MKNVVFFANLLKVCGPVEGVLLVEGVRLSSLGVRLRSIRLGVCGSAASVCGSVCATRTCAVSVLSLIHI